MKPVPRASVDTCFFLRYLTGSPPDQAEQAEKILQQAERGEIQLVVPPLVIAEIIWVLETSVFNLSKQEAAEKAIAILNLRNIHVDNSRLLEEAAVLHAELNIDYTDAYLACFAKAEGLENVYTFDKKDFSKVQWLRVLP
jgi:predicted nucleic acid-binding protein